MALPLAAMFAHSLSIVDITRHSLHLLLLVSYWLLVVEKLDELFGAAGYETVERTYVERRTVNKKENIDVPRIFVQGRYRKVSRQPC